MRLPRLPLGNKLWVVVAVAGMAIALFGGTALDRSSPVTAVEGVVDTPVLRRGDTFRATWSVTVARICRGSSERWLESSSAHDWYGWLPGSDYSALSGHVTTVPRTVSFPSFSFAIPATMPTGPASYHVVSTFRCNWLGHMLFPINIVYPPLLFEVADGP